MTDDKINLSMALNTEAYPPPGSRPAWRFTVEADKLPDGGCVVRVRTASGRVCVRTGRFPLWELIRIVGRDLRKQYQPRPSTEDGGAA